MSDTLTQERLHELFFYNPIIGVFVRRIAVNGADIPAGAIAGHLRARDGSIRMRVDGKHYCAHRLAWLYVHGRWPEKFLDHADRNPSNNALNNLREATIGQNAAAMSAAEKPFVYDEFGDLRSGRYWGDVLTEELKAISPNYDWRIGRIYSTLVEIEVVEKQNTLFGRILWWWNSAGKVVGRGTDFHIYALAAERALESVKP